MKRVLITTFLTMLYSSVIGQNSSAKLALTLYDDFSKTSKVALFDFEDPLRYQWRRTPGKRHGIALYDMTSEQKIQLHKMLSDVLSSSGYGKVGHVLFNEDLSQEFDPNTGQNKYWFAFYGKPSEESLWGWRLEGHHLSMNFTFNGEELVSSTPFVLGSYPAEIKKDTVRAGFRTLSKEIDYGFQLIQSMSLSQQEQVIISDEKPSGRLVAESNKVSIKKPIGIKYGELNESQKIVLRRLVMEYTSNINKDIEVDFSKINFAWWGKIDGTSKYWYRLHSKDLLIELEDIGNHIHSTWRMLKSDFYTNPFKN